MNARKTITTAALALGVLAGSAGIANALTTTEQPATTVDDETQELTETDGIDHEFEGEEIGENGDGVPDADDALEAAPAN